MALPFSRLDVVNQALIELGRLPVTNINDSEDAELLNAKLNLLFPVLLQETVWNFGILFKEDDTPLATALFPDFTYSYQLPSDYGRLFQFGSIGVGFDQPFIISNQIISTNQNPISYYYIVNSVSITAVSTLFFRALGLFLASDCCLVLTENEKLEVNLARKFEYWRGKAVNLNDMERYVTSMPYNDYDRLVLI